MRSARLFGALAVALLGLAGVVAGRGGPPPEEGSAGGVKLRTDCTWVMVGGNALRPRAVCVRSAAELADALERAADEQGCAKLGWAGESPEEGRAYTIRERPSSACEVEAGLMGARECLVLGVPVALEFATADDLALLPGIGPALARRIVAERTARGGFTTLDELLDVRGIGPSRLAILRRWVTASSRAGPGGPSARPLRPP